MIKSDKVKIQKLTKEILKIASKHNVYLSITVNGEGSKPWAYINDVPRNYYKEVDKVCLSEKEALKARLIKEVKGNA